MKIELRHIHKRFGPIHANNDISLTFGGGRLIGVLGENGAGKSTLMKILAGYQPADSGEIWIDDKHVDYTGPEAAIEHGIGMLQQDPLDVGAFSVLENFTYGSRSGFFLNRDRIRRRLLEIAGPLGFDLDPDRHIEQLSIAQRQQLEIVRLLALGIRTLILDEPTTGISADQKDMLFDTLRRLAHEDGMTVLLVSHKLEDVLALCDEVVVLRAGLMVGDLEMPATKAQLVHMMFGQEVTFTPRPPSDLDGAPVLLQLSGADLRDGRLHIANASLSLRAGEVVGVAGMDGSGQELLMRACAGLTSLHGGHVQVGQRDMSRSSYPEFMRAGVVFGAAGRLEEGLIAGMTLTEHMALVHQHRTLVDWRQARQFTEQQIAHYAVRGRAYDFIETLSGGNQQRALMAMLPEAAQVLVLEQPTRGLDVDSARWIWEQLLARRAQGAAILFSSADLDELMLYSDRLIVCYAGKLYPVDDLHAVTVSDLGHLIGGDFSRGGD